MNLANFSADITGWSQIPEVRHPGESGTAAIRSRQAGDIQLRLVTYSANYIAGHWCHKGHIVFVVAGQLVIEYQQGPPHALTPGTSYHVPDSDGPAHRVTSTTGATIFILD